MDHDLITIKDYGRAEYLDGAMMQYTVLIGDYSNGTVVAYCETLEIARLLANAMVSIYDGQVVLDRK